MQENYFSTETLKAALEAKGITNNAQAKPVIDAMIRKGAIIQGINEPKTALSTAKDVAVGAVKGLGRTGYDLASGVQDIVQAGVGGVESALTGKPVEETKTLSPSFGIEALKKETPQGQQVQQSLKASNSAQEVGGYLETGAELLAGGGYGLVKDAVVGGTKLLAKGASKVAPTLKKSGEYAHGTAFTPSIKEAELAQAYEASQPSITSKLLGTDSIVGNPTFKPITTKETAFRQGISGTEKNIGKRSKAVADTMWNKEIAPEVEKSAVRMSKEEMFAPVEERIAKTINPSKKQALQDALDSVKSDYGSTVDFSLKDAQKLKSELDEFTPTKMFRGQDVASELKVVNHDMANAIRSKTYDSLSDHNIKQKYIDYGNLQELQKVGIKARTDASSKGGFGSFWSGVYDKLATPIKTYGGKTLYKVGDVLEFEAPKSFKGKTLGDYLRSVGYLAPQVAEKSITSAQQ